MYEIPKLNKNLLKIFKSEHEDLFDLLYYYLTPTILIIFAFFTSAKQYFGKPIQCWIPWEFKGGWEQYVEDYCFVQNTYQLPNNELFNIDTVLGLTKEKKELSYYQWVPILLILQSILFVLPNWLWIAVKEKIFDLQNIISDVSTVRDLPTKERSCVIQKFVQQNKDKFLYNKNSWIFKGFYLSIFYMLIKILRLLNLFLQFYLLVIFIGDGYWSWGLSALKTIKEGNGWKDSTLFPRVTFCDFKVHQLANDHNYTVQCVLMINMFNEKIYLFIWFWLVLLMIAAVVDIIYNFINILFIPYGKMSTNKRITNDGLLILHFIQNRIGRANTKELIEELQENSIDKIV